MNWLLRIWRLYRCRCEFKHFCRRLDLRSPTCMCSGKNYCGAHRGFSRDFEGACASSKGRFDVVTWQPWGKCMVIPRGEFNRHIGAFLLSRGYRPYYDMLDGSCMLIVPFKHQRREAQ